MGPDGVVRVFFVQGAMIGWAGVLIGVVLGVVLAINVPVIVPFLEQLLRFPDHAGRRLLRDTHSVGT